MRAVLIALSLALSSCASMHLGRLTAKEVQAVRSAEAFILRHGYTPAGHPDNKPVVPVESMDFVSTEAQLVEWRQNSLEARAFGVTPCECDTDAYYVFFRRIKPGDGFRGVLVENGEAEQVVHSTMILDGWPWKLVSGREGLGGGSTPSASSKSAQLEQLNRSYDLALLNADGKTLDSLYADDFQYFGPKGVVRDKATQIATLTSGEVDLIEGQSSNVRIRIYDSTAVLTGQFSGRVRASGREFAFDERYSTVWVERGGEWKMVLEHGSVIEKAE